MKMKMLRTPHLPEPLSAALVGAGSFLFLAALTGFGPFQAADRAAWRLSQPGQAQATADSAVRVLATEGPGGSARLDRLAADVTWLRAQGAGAIVVEAWLNEPPQAEARALADSLRANFQSLPAAARDAALKALSQSAQSLDQDQRLSRALGAAQPLVLAYATRRGGELDLPPALARQG
jgi:hypothetical protein